MVEDEPKVVRFLERGLRQQFYAVDVAMDGTDGLRMARESNYDLVVLEVMLPGLDDFSLLRELRRDRQHARALMLTARDGVEDRVRGLDLGADDYLIKPFDLMSSWPGSARCCVGPQRKRGYYFGSTI